MWGQQYDRIAIHLPVVVLDIETTGLSSVNDEIIEVAAIRFDPSKSRHAAMQHLVRATRPLSANITALTGITDDDLSQSGVSRRVAMQNLVDFIGDLPIVAFNAAFDTRFLCAALDAEQIPANKRGSCCALQLARATWPGLSSYRLDALAALHGLDLTTSHRALDDARRCAHVYYRALGAVTRDVPI